MAWTTLKAIHLACYYMKTYDHSRWPCWPREQHSETVKVWGLRDSPCEAQVFPPSIKFRMNSTDESVMLTLIITLPEETVSIDLTKLELLGRGCLFQSVREFTYTTSAETYYGYISFSSTEYSILSRLCNQSPAMPILSTSTGLNSLKMNLKRSWVWICSRFYFALDEHLPINDI